MVLRRRSEERRYQIGIRIAKGALSEVYQAKSSDIRRPLAVKRLIVGSVDGEERLAEFVRETAVVASLDHPNIVGVIDAGEHHDDFVLVMEYVDGVSVLDILTYLRRHKDRLDVELTCGIVGQVARGLSHAHDRTLRDGTPLGIVHRNVTPPNIFVTRSGVPKLLDFGMATLEGHEVTMPGVVRGTDDYLSPEQARGEKVDPRTDVFCLGAVAYELLSGRSFYPRPADRDLMRIQAGDLEPIAPRLAGVDPEAAARLPETDTQRLLRAYEVYLATGKSLSDWHREAPTTGSLSADVQTVFLAPPRRDLYARCNDRFDMMMEQGALDEVAGLVAQGLDSSLPAMKALGVPELAAHLTGGMTREVAVEKAKQATRNFAKRQMTWFRNQIEKPDVVFTQYSERIRDKIFSKICF